MDVTAAPFGNQKRTPPGRGDVTLPPHTDAGIYFIGIIRTPWQIRRECPKRGNPDGPLCVSPDAEVFLGHRKSVAWTSSAGESFGRGPPRVAGLTLLETAMQQRLAPADLANSAASPLPTPFWQPKTVQNSADERLGELTPTSLT